jgi:cysteinyl-tRNA synthetase
MVTVDGTKMGKSLNNFINLKQVFTGEHERLSRAYDPIAVRMLVLNSHYRSPLDFSDAALTAAQSGLDRIIEAVRKLRKAISGAADAAIDADLADQIESLSFRFQKAMNDDINTSVALSVIYELVKLSNKQTASPNASKKTLEAINDAFNRLAGDALGVVLESYPETASATDDRLLDYLMSGIIEQREKARENKDWEKADRLRDEMAEFGITFKDTPQGTQWIRS